MENKKKVYEIRLEVTDDLIPVWPDFRLAIDTFKNNLDVELHFYYWYDGNKTKKINLNTGFIVNDTCGINKVMFDIRSHIDNPDDIKHCKYYFIYTDADTFIHNLFQMFSFIKAMINHEEQKNDSRNDRKRTFYKKTRNKKIIMDDETSTTK